MGNPHDHSKTFFPDAEALVVCAPFVPDRNKSYSGARFFFVSGKKMLDQKALAVAILSSGRVYAQHRFFSEVHAVAAQHGVKVEAIPDARVPNRAVSQDLWILLASDTHAFHFLELSMASWGAKVVVPDSTLGRDAGAAALLKSRSIPFFELNQKDIARHPFVGPCTLATFCDWNAEFLRLNEHIRTIPGSVSVVISEGPQDYITQVNNRGTLARVRKLHSADIALLMGSNEMSEVRPKFFSALGLMKTASGFGGHFPTANHTVMINLNFSYTSLKPPYEAHGESWLKEVIDVVRDLGIDYFVSQHPRSDISGPEGTAIISNASSLDWQIRRSTLVISRFSSVIYEAVVAGKDVIYFNPHREPMPTFNLRTEGAIPLATNASQLWNLVRNHMLGEELFSAAEKNLFISHHLGPDPAEYGARLRHFLSEISRSGESPTVLQDLLGESETSGNRDRTVVVFASLPQHAYSGGRYFVISMCHAIALAGFRVVVVTDNIPLFHRDFLNTPHHDQIEFVLSDNFRGQMPTEVIPFAVICVPDLSARRAVYNESRKLANNHSAPLIMINFETPDWFNELSPIPRSTKLWASAQALAPECDLIVSISHEGRDRALRFYGSAVGRAEFVTVYPGINSHSADRVTTTSSRTRIFFPLRLSGTAHKGAADFLEIISSDWKGYTVTVLAETGTMAEGYLSQLKDKCLSVGVGFESFSRLSDIQKFSTLKQTAVTVFPSIFEGFGYPLIESLYCGTPCVTYDLPVFREVAGRFGNFSKVGDTKQLGDRVTSILRSPPDSDWRRQASQYAFEVSGMPVFAQNLLTVLGELPGRKPSAQESRKVGQLIMVRRKDSRDSAKRIADFLGVSEKLRKIYRELRRK